MGIVLQIAALFTVCVFIQSQPSHQGYIQDFMALANCINSLPHNNETHDCGKVTLRNCSCATSGSMNILLCGCMQKNCTNVNNDDCDTYRYCKGINGSGFCSNSNGTSCEVKLDTGGTSREGLGGGQLTSPTITCNLTLPTATTTTSTHHKLTATYTTPEVKVTAVNAVPTASDDTTPTPMSPDSKKPFIISSSVAVVIAASAVGMIVCMFIKMKVNKRLKHSQLQTHTQSLEEPVDGLRSIPLRSGHTQSTAAHDDDDAHTYESVDLYRKSLPQNHHTKGRSHPTAIQEHGYFTLETPLEADECARNGPAINDEPPKDLENDYATPHASLVPSRAEILENPSHPTAPEYAQVKKKRIRDKSLTETMQGPSTVSLPIGLDIERRQNAGLPEFKEPGDFHIYGTLEPPMSCDLHTQKFSATTYATTQNGSLTPTDMKRQHF